MPGKQSCVSAIVKTKVTLTGIHCRCQILVYLTILSVLDLFFFFETLFYLLERESKRAIEKAEGAEEADSPLSRKFNDAWAIPGPRIIT